MISLTPEERKNWTATIEEIVENLTEIPEERRQENFEYLLNSIIEGAYSPDCYGRVIGSLERIKLNLSHRERELYREEPAEIEENE